MPSNQIIASNKKAKLVEPPKKVTTADDDDHRQSISSSTSVENEKSTYKPTKLGSNSVVKSYFKKKFSIEDGTGGSETSAAAAAVTKKAQLNSSTNLNDVCVKF